MKFLLLFGIGLLPMNCIAMLASLDTIIVLGELVEEKGGDKVHIATYHVVKVLQGKVSNDTIQVGYYGEQAITQLPQQARLNIEPYQGQTIIKDYYICPNYNLNEGIEKVKIDEVSRAFWLGCETGEGKCPIIEFIRPAESEDWYLLMPCGGTQTNILFYKEGTNLEDSGITDNINISASECPPILDLTELADGVYSISMLSCGLGGTINIKIETAY